MLNCGCVVFTQWCWRVRGVRDAPAQLQRLQICVRDVVGVASFSTVRVAVTPCVWTRLQVQVHGTQGAHHAHTAAAVANRACEPVRPSDAALTPCNAGYLDPPPP